MSAAVLAPAGSVTGERAVLHMALEAGHPTAGAAAVAVWTAILRLDHALRAHQEQPGQAQAEKAARAAGELTVVMTRHCGPGWGGAL